MERNLQCRIASSPVGNGMVFFLSVFIWMTVSSLQGSGVTLPAPVSPIVMTSSRESWPCSALPSLSSDLLLIFISFAIELHLSVFYYRNKILEAEWLYKEEKFIWLITHSSERAIGLEKGGREKAAEHLPGLKRPFWNYPLCVACQLYLNIHHL